jgi:hypothetical protein
MATTSAPGTNQSSGTSVFSNAPAPAQPSTSAANLNNPNWKKELNLPAKDARPQTEVSSDCFFPVQLETISNIAEKRNELSTDHDHDLTQDVTATKGNEFEDYFLKRELLMGIFEAGVRLTSSFSPVTAFIFSKDDPLTDIYYLISSNVHHLFKRKLFPLH